MRKIAYFILVVVGVSISPPDFVSDILIIIPLLLLFEISIWVSSMSLKRKLAKRETTRGKFEGINLQCAILSEVLY